MSDGQPDTAPRLSEERIADTEAAIAQWLAQIDLETFTVDYALIRRGSGGIGSVVERSTAMHALLYVRQAARKELAILTAERERQYNLGFLAGHKQAKERLTALKAEVHDARELCGLHALGKDLDAAEQRAEAAESQLAALRAQLEQLAVECEGAWASEKCSAWFHGAAETCREFGKRLRIVLASQPDPPTRQEPCGYTVADRETDASVECTLPRGHVGGHDFTDRQEPTLSDPEAEKAKQDIEDLDVAMLGIGAGSPNPDTPSARDQALAALVTRWEEAAVWEQESGSPEFGKGLDQCASDLKALLVSPSTPNKEP